MWAPTWRMRVCQAKGQPLMVAVAVVGGQGAQGLKLVHGGPSVSSGRQAPRGCFRSWAALTGLAGRGTRKTALQSGALLLCLLMDLGTRNGPGTDPAPSLSLRRNAAGGPRGAGPGPGFAPVLPLGLAQFFAPQASVSRPTEDPNTSPAAPSFPRPGWLSPLFPLITADTPLRSSSAISSGSRPQDCVRADISTDTAQGSALPQRPVRTAPALTDAG